MQKTHAIHSFLNILTPKTPTRFREDPQKICECYEHYGAGNQSHHRDFGKAPACDAHPDNKNPESEEFGVIKKQTVE
jgi:hypothetical protein